MIKKVNQIKPDKIEKIEKFNFYIYNKKNNLIFNEKIVKKNSFEKNYKLYDLSMASMIFESIGNLIDYMIIFDFKYCMGYKVHAIINNDYDLENDIYYCFVFDKELKDGKKTN